MLIYSLAGIYHVHSHPWLPTCTFCGVQLYLSAWASHGFIPVVFFSYSGTYKGSIFTGACHSCTLILWFCCPWPHALIRIDFHNIPLEKRICIIFKWELPEGGGSVGCYLCVQVLDGLYRRQSRTAQWQTKRQQAQKKNRKIYSCIKTEYFVVVWTVGMDGKLAWIGQRSCGITSHGGELFMTRNCPWPRANGCRWPCFEQRGWVGEYLEFPAYLNHSMISQIDLLICWKTVNSCANTVTAAWNVYLNIKIINHCKLVWIFFIVVSIN